MKRTFLGVLLLCLACIILPTQAAIIESGTCGNNLTWTLTDDGKLTICGTGEMNNYDYNNSSPWVAHRDNIKTALIEQGVTSIGNDAFSYCSGLIAITIPESVTSIKNYAFYGCSSLASINIPEGVTSIKNYAFYGCNSLASINIPEGVTSIGKGTFAYCISLTSINIPESVTSIGYEAFWNCNSLTSINIPESVTSIGEGAFGSCESLISITIPESVTSIKKYAFYGCSSLAFINIPEGVTSIGEGTFMDCSSLASINIPKSVTSIGNSAFYDCSNLTSVTIPEGVTSIGEKAFVYCSSLTQMTVLATTPPTVGTTAFNDVSRDIPVYVPEESLTAYQNADVWKEFNLQAKGSTNLHAPVLSESIKIYDGLLHNPQGLTVSLYDMQGCQVYSGKATILRMPSGVYVLQCGKASGKVMFP